MLSFISLLFDWVITSWNACTVWILLLTFVPCRYSCSTMLCTTYYVCEMVLLIFNFKLIFCGFCRFKEAEDDCTEALNLDDRYIKAYSRRATARKELRKLRDALEGRLHDMLT